MFAHLPYYCFLSTIPITYAQSIPPSSPPSPTSSPTSSVSVLPSASGYSYIGCYNETTGDSSVGNVRALAGGTMTAADDMTVAQCMSFCGNSKYAGLEYGRECWCAPDLNQYATKLPDTGCNFPCGGASAQVCGGSLMLSTYQKDAGTHSSAGTETIGQQSLSMFVLLPLFAIYMTV